MPGCSSIAAAALKFRALPPVAESSASCRLVGRSSTSGCAGVQEQQAEEGHVAVLELRGQLEEREGELRALRRERGHLLAAIRHGAGGLQPAAAGELPAALPCVRAWGLPLAAVGGGSRSAPITTCRWWALESRVHPCEFWQVHEKSWNVPCAPQGWTVCALPRRRLRPPHVLFSRLCAMLCAKCGARLAPRGMPVIAGEVLMLIQRLHAARHVQPAWGKAGTRGLHLPAADGGWKLTAAPLPRGSCRGEEGGAGAFSPHHSRQPPAGFSSTVYPHIPPRRRPWRI
jgi:hypothetical protein